MNEKRIFNAQLFENQRPLKQKSSYKKINIFEESFNYFGHQYNGIFAALMSNRVCQAPLIGI